MVLVIMAILDGVYTSLYANAVPRSKFQYFRSFKNQKINYLFLGSSRVENDIVPSLIQKQTAKTAVNFGFQAAKMKDIFTLLQLVKQYNIQADTILIQVDYIFNLEEDCSNVLPYQIMPFINDNQVTKAYCDLNFKESMKLRWIPFYRYSSYESKIGFRELFANAINKKTTIATTFGYYGLEGTSNEFDESLPQTILDKNNDFEKIKAFGKKNHWNILFFCAPFSKQTKNLEYIQKLKEKIPDLYDFSQVVQEDRLFKNAFHLNNEGAHFFTEKLIKELLLQKN